jgi:hypothetical protein
MNTLAWLTMLEGSVARPRLFLGIVSGKLSTTPGGLISFNQLFQSTKEAG